MTTYSPIFRLALGALWTAGHRPDQADKSALRAACGSDPDLNDLYATGGTTQAIAALKRCGYEVTDEDTIPRGSYDLVKPLPLQLPTVPMASHVARLTGKGWSIMKEGSFVGLQGDLTSQQRGYEIANAVGGWHRYGDCITMGNGGPASIAYLDTRRLRPTDETYRLLAWSWIERPQANGGANFYLTVPVWEWTPTTDAADFLSWEDAQQPF